MEPVARVTDVVGAGNVKLVMFWGEAKHDCSAALLGVDLRSGDCEDAAVPGWERLAPICR